MIAAGLWGLLAGSALWMGALVGYYARLPPRLVAGVMAFGAGVLISALSFELFERAYESGGFAATALGFVGGAGAFTAANLALSRHGAKHRKRSGDQQPSEDEHAGSGAAIALGALLDGVPESIVIGVSLLGGRGVSLVAVAAVFLSNVPEGLSSASGMRRAGRSIAYVLGTWSAIAIASGIASLVGFVAFEGLAPSAIAATTAIAAGAILAMIADTMIPEAFEGGHALTGLVTSLGFLAAFVLAKLGE